MYTVVPSVPWAQVEGVLWLLVDTLCGRDQRTVVYMLSDQLKGDVAVAVEKEPQIIQYVASDGPMRGERANRVS